MPARRLCPQHIGSWWAEPVLRRTSLSA